MSKPVSEDDEAQTYRDWLRQRRRTEIPSGFSDRVMQRLPADPPARESLAIWMKAAVITLAALLTFGRYLIVIIFLFVG